MKTIFILGLIFGLLCVSRSIPKFQIRATSTSNHVSAVSPNQFPTITPMRLIYGIATQSGSRSFMTEISSEGLAEKIDLPYHFVDADFSFDGQFIAFDNCGQPGTDAHGIYVANLVNHKVREILPLTSKFCVAVRWSPDGKKLSFADPTDRQIYIIELATNKVRTLPNISDAGWHWWSPWGDQIVFEKGRGGSRELFITDLNGQERQLTFRKDFNGETWAPSWSRDGSRIVFTGADPGRKYSLYTIAPNGLELKKLETPGAVYAPRWSTDGEWILFMDGTRLMRIRKNGTDLTLVGDLPKLISPFSLAPKN